MYFLLPVCQVTEGHDPEASSIYNVMPAELSTGEAFQLVAACPHRLWLSTNVRYMRRPDLYLTDVTVCACSDVAVFFVAPGASNRIDHP